MNHDGSISTVERALELARGGTCLSVPDVRRKLRAEGFSAVDETTAGPTFQAQLKAAIQKAKE